MTLPRLVSLGMVLTAFVILGVGQFADAQPVEYNCGSGMGFPPCPGEGLLKHCDDQSLVGEPNKICLLTKVPKGWNLQGETFPLFCTGWCADNPDSK